MLIYNYKKEFLGIDESDLEALGLSTLADLRAESADFADLFVRTPGCIHNFKHVHWIDYVLDKDGAEAKVIIHVKNKNYSANLNINTAYLVDSPSEKAFSIILLNIKALSSSQTDKLLTDINNKVVPTPADGPTELFTIPSSSTESIIEEDDVELSTTTEYDPYESPIEEPLTVDDIYETEVEVEDLTADDAPVDEEIESIKYQEEDNQEEEIEIFEEVKDNIPSVEEEEIEEEILEESNEIEVDEFATYVYNPEVASEELGLPIDLIEEFIQDFITQALSFKDELYQSIEDEKLDNIKIQSHKLKGVAANLRIEDALDALTKANTSTNYEEIKLNIDRLYLMIDKLSSKTSEINLAKDVSVEDIIDNDDELVLSFKEDNIEFEISDDDVPDTITVAELADDDFLATDISDEDIQDTKTTQDELLDLALEYDKEIIANDIGIDLESFNELFDDYIRESKELAQTITQSADNNDLKICKNLAIKIKGMSENMRVNKLNSNLDDIINATDIKKIKISAQEIISKLIKIDTKE